MAAHATHYQGTGPGEDPAQVPRILLADDNPEVLAAVARLLADDFVLVGAVSDGASVLREAMALKPDIIILDISLGDLSGIEVARRLKEMGCLAKLVFLTVHQGPDFIRAALGAGASAYVFKSTLACDLVAAIQAAGEDRIFISSGE